MSKMASVSVNEGNSNGKQDNLSNNSPDFDQATGEWAKHNIKKLELKFRSSFEEAESLKEILDQMKTNVAKLGESLIAVTERNKYLEEKGKTTKCEISELKAWMQSMIKAQGEQERASVRNKQEKVEEMKAIQVNREEIKENHKEARKAMNECQNNNKVSYAKMNLSSSTSVGAIGTLPPKLVRPQPKHAQPSTKQGNQASVPKDDSVSSNPSYKRLIDICKQRFGKDFTSPDICSAMREVRAQNNNSLTGMTTEKILERVRTTLRGRRPGSGQASVAPWAGLALIGGNTGPEWKGPKEETGIKEETCSICLEALTASPTVPLQCQHVFHEHCIKDWLKRQSNCPNCRTFALMTDEYPTLPQN